MYAENGAGQGVARSYDGGWTWEGGPPGGNIEVVAVDPADPQNLYTCVAFEGLYRSTDGGETWEPFNEGLANVAVQAIAFHPDDPQRVYAATLGGVYERLLNGIFLDGFESGDTTAWSQTVD